jgi:GntR family transcriptional regulator
VLPFTVRFRPGVPPYEEVLLAVRRALAYGRLRPGQPFPSVRTLSQELRLNPNTAHKVVAALVSDGLLEVRPGVGTVIAATPPTTSAQRRQLLSDDVARLVVDARLLSLELADVVAAIELHWKRLGGRS